MSWIDIATKLAVRIPWENMIIPHGDDGAIKRLEVMMKTQAIASDHPVIEEKIEPAVPEPVAESPPKGNDLTSDLSQVSAEGKACIPCGNDHFSTAAGLLSESIRFARSGGITDPEVIKRIAAAEDELNAFERVDGAPENVIRLPDMEKDLMNEMLAASRKLRHDLSDINSADDLESTAAGAREMRKELRGKLFAMQVAKAR